MAASAAMVVIVGIKPTLNKRQITLRYSEAKNTCAHTHQISADWWPDHAPARYLKATLWRYVRVVTVV